MMLLVSGIVFKLLALPYCQGKYSLYRCSGWISAPTIIALAIRHR